MIAIGIVDMAKTEEFSQNGQWVSRFWSRIPSPPLPSPSQRVCPPALHIWEHEQAMNDAGLSLQDFMGAYDSAVPLTMQLCDKVMVTTFNSMIFIPLIINVYFATHYYNSNT